MFAEFRMLVNINKYSHEGIFTAKAISKLGNIEELIIPVNSTVWAMVRHGLYNRANSSLLFSEGVVGQVRSVIITSVEDG